MSMEYSLKLEYPEMLFLAYMMNEEIEKLKRVCEKYKRYSETGDKDGVWIEKLTVHQGQLSKMQGVYQRLSEIIAVCRIENMII